MLAAGAGGEIFERLHQPAVLGEPAFGILLGKLGLLGLEVEALRYAPFLAVAAEIGVILPLFQIGLESDPDDLLAVGPSAVTVAAIGGAAPLTLGIAVSSVFVPEDVAWYAHPFAGHTLAATSVGIAARGRIEKAESKLVPGAAVVDGILGLVILAFMPGSVHSADRAMSASFSLMPLILIGVKAVGVSMIPAKRWG